MTEPVGARPSLLSGYQPGPLDEAVDPGGQVRPGYTEIVAALDTVGIDGVRAAVRRLGNHSQGRGHHLYRRGRW